MPLRTWVPIWWVIFYSFGMERKSSSSSRAWIFACIIPVLSPCSFHPPCWRLDEGWIFPPSSILHRWNLPNSWGVPVSVGIHILFVTRARICLVFMWMWDLDLDVKWNGANVFDDVIIRVYT
jgi:hypothetical protein